MDSQTTNSRLEAGASCQRRPKIGPLPLHSPPYQGQDLKGPIRAALVAGSMR